MKRCAALILISCLLAAALVSGAAAEGELRGYSKEDGYVYVYLGAYPQRIDGGIPEENLNAWKWASNKISDLSTVTIYTDPILWRVLTVDDEKAYLCSEYILFSRPLHPSMKEYREIGADFGNTELSHYLNETFAPEAFTEAELEMLLPCETFGKVFLLDSADANNKAYGLGKAAKPTAVKNNLKAWPTEYCAKTMKIFVASTKYGSNCAYWCRNQSKSDKRHGISTKVGGVLGHLHCDAEDIGVRPVVYLDLNAFSIGGGSGTRTDPYVIVPKSQ